MTSSDETLIPFDPLHDTVDRLLETHFANPVTITQATLLTEVHRRNRIWRCCIESTDIAIPSTVIVKQVAPDGYNPSDPSSWDTGRFFADWAGAQFLSECAPGAGHGPAFYGGDRELGFILLEDMGEHKSLVEPLLEGNAAGATDALLAFARRLGAMHAATIGKEARYREIQEAIDPAWAATVASTDRAAEERKRQITEFKEIATDLEVEIGEKAIQELEGALDGLAEPGVFNAFIHGDPCPDNVFYAAPDLRLIDFEFSRFGHALRDGLYGRLPFPTCWCANAIPGEVVQKMESVYRSAVAPSCPEVMDEERFDRETIAVAASWVLMTTEWHLKVALKNDHTWGISGIRARLLTRLEMFLEVSRRTHQMTAFADIAARILDELYRRWPDASALPLYPAFRTTEESV